ncbi:MAG: hypothetical protein A3I71_04720 [Omnitrophica WOR_2 bacterium RIFCSPLOWO2_02_FULL_63_16]|nr:MAG: hypothetical protein A2105_02750 [Omnitrophica WOR_2 bacterium GWF2_63_9]OGX45529.1 MAG: hypothetical protein A3I71_04720 [Omnitrophica WOR_2 bacterium RIFCSPLOWO2_02_FULL_63_16]
MQRPMPGWTWWQTCAQTARLFGSHRRLFLPFVLTAFVELLLIGGVWLAPHQPFAKILAPPIRYFFGDRTLHYPWHLWFLYHAMQQTSVVAATLVGAFMTGIACVMVRQIHEGQPLSFRAALAGRHVRYGRLVLLWLIAWAVTHGTMLLVVRATPALRAAPWIQVGSLLALQALFIYLIPAAVFNGSPWWKAILQGIRETLRHPVSTLALLGAASSGLIAFSIGVPETRLAQWMVRFEPELALAAVGGRLLLFALTDAVLTVGMAHLWWFHRAGAPAPVRAAQAQPALAEVPA